MTATVEGAVIAAFLAFCRIGACFLVMPGLSSVRVPMQVRLFVALAATGGLLVLLWDQIYPFADRRPAVLVPRFRLRRPPVRRDCALPCWTSAAKPSRSIPPGE